MITVKTVTVSLVENPDGTYAFTLTSCEETEVQTFTPDPGHLITWPST
jgi:hypothetical protein